MTGHARGHEREDEDYREGEFVGMAGSGIVPAGATTIAVPLQAPCPGGSKWCLRLLNWYGWPNPMTVVAGTSEAYLAAERAQIGQVSPFRLVDGLSTQAGPAIGNWTGQQVVAFPGELIVVVFRALAAGQQMIVNTHWEQYPLTPAELERYGRAGTHRLGAEIEVEAEVHADTELESDRALGAGQATWAPARASWRSLLGGNR